MEHSATFPIDTMKTHIQVRGVTTSSIQELIKACGVPRLWRGVQTMFAGCIPAHAAYFSIYETLKPLLSKSLQSVSLASAVDSFTDTPEGSTSEAVGAGAAVSVATVAHDIVMTPMDVMKQRLQLGYHENSIVDCLRSILREQGPRAFVVSLPITLCMNVPYAAIMGTANEVLRKRLSPDATPSTPVFMLAGTCSGAIAAAATTPLDVVKTRLQTQHLPSLAPREAAADAARVATSGHGPAARAAVLVAVPRQPLVYLSALEACSAIYLDGGARAFFRGMQARILVHAPTVGICWTTYETVKHLLGNAGDGTKPAAATPAAAAENPMPAAVSEAPLPFIDHSIAGSLAGIAEHAAVFPIDTIKTHVQAASAEEIAANGTLGTTRNIIRQHGISHLFRGLSALLPAVGPAHALMFSAYEQCLQIGGAKERGASAERVAAVGAAAGVVSTILHDSCMVPAETIKQRLQLGYYRDALHCFQAMLATGGGSFFRSLPTTLAMNIPYGSLMIMSNESLKRWLNPSSEFDLGVYLVSGGISGAVAAGLTTPLDVVKTRLQVQTLSAPTTGVGAAPGDAFVVRYSGFLTAGHAVAVEEGFAGFWRGVGPRMAMYGPSCAISWVAYESCKKLLVRARHRNAYLEL